MYWFTSYNGFAESVDFAYWWSCIGKGLRLEPAQQACFKYSGLFFLGDLGKARECSKNNSPLIT